MIFMPTLEWIGKDKVINHHQEVPFRVLERKYSFDESGRHEEDNGSSNMIIHGDNLDNLSVQADDKMAAGIGPAAVRLVLQTLKVTPVLLGRGPRIGHIMDHHIVDPFHLDARSRVLSHRNKLLVYPVGCHQGAQIHIFSPGEEVLIRKLCHAESRAEGQRHQQNRNQDPAQDPQAHPMSSRRIRTSAAGFRPVLILIQVYSAQCILLQPKGGGLPPCAMFALAALPLLSQWTSVVLSSGQIFTGTCINLNLVADVDKQRYRNLSTCLYSCRLGSTGSGVALESRLSICNLQFHEKRSLDGEDVAVVGKYLYGLVLLDKLHRVTGQLLAESDLLISIGIHEVEKVSILVKELHVNLIDSRGRELLCRTEGSLYYAAVDDVLNLCSDESSTLSRLNMLELHDLINDSVDLQSNTVSEITC